MDYQLFLNTTNFECMFVTFERDKLALYEDKELTVTHILRKNEHLIFEVQFEYDEGEKLALSYADQMVYTDKQSVIPMLFSEYDLKKQVNSLYYCIDGQWFKFDGRLNVSTETHVNNPFELLANHLKILNELQRDKHFLSMKKLIGDNINQRKKLEQVIQEKEKILTRYLKLRQSKLGKIQVKLWESR